MDNATLQRLLNNPEAMRALMRIEGFRSLNSDIETIINKSEHVRNVKKSKGDEGLSQKEKRQLSEEEKEYKSKRREIQEKLIKFATRIPVFMYLTDYREYCLKDVIMQLEPELFRKVTGLTLKDFSLLVSLNVFNSELMNDAVYKFKRYEDDSLEYTGINTHDGRMVGGWDTVVDTGKTARSESSGKCVVVSAGDGASRMQVDAETSVGEVERAHGSDSMDKDTVRQSCGLVLSSETRKATSPWRNISVSDTVRHRSLGGGTVMSLDDKYIIVRFRDRESKFLFPGAFEKGYLEE